MARLHSTDDLRSEIETRVRHLSLHLVVQDWGVGSISRGNFSLVILAPLIIGLAVIDDQAALPTWTTWHATVDAHTISVLHEVGQISKACVLLLGDSNYRKLARLRSSDHCSVAVSSTSTITAVLIVDSEQPYKIGREKLGLPG